MNRSRRSMLGLLAGTAASRALAQPISSGSRFEVVSNPEREWLEVVEGGESRSCRSSTLIPDQAPVHLHSFPLGEIVPARSRPFLVDRSSRIWMTRGSGAAVLEADGSMVTLGSTRVTEAQLVGSTGGTVALLFASGGIDIWDPAQQRRFSPIEIDQPIVGSAVPLHDGSLVLTCVDRTLRSVDRTGVERFRIRLEGGAPVGTSRAYDRLFCTVGEQLHLLSLDGVLMKRLALPSRAVGPAALSDRGDAWIPMANGLVQKIEYGRRLGPRATVRSELRLERPAIAADGSFRIAARERGVAAFDSEGILLWECATSSPVASGLRIDPDGRVLAIDRTPRLHAIDARGAPMWSVSLPEHVIDLPFVLPDQRIVLMGERGLLMLFGRPEQQTGVRSNSHDRIDHSTGQ